MSNKAPLSDLIESAIGVLGITSISHFEEIKHSNSDNQKIKDALSRLQTLINGADPQQKASPKFMELLVQILKSTDMKCQPEFISFLGRKFPSIMMGITNDTVIKNRVYHIDDVMELNECFALKLVKRFNHGVECVRRESFDINARNDDVDGALNPLSIANEEDI